MRSRLTAQVVIGTAMVIALCFSSWQIISSYFTAHAYPKNSIGGILHFKPYHTFTFWPWLAIVVVSGLILLVLGIQLDVRLEEEITYERIRKEVFDELNEHLKNSPEEEV